MSNTDPVALESTIQPTVHLTSPVTQAVLRIQQQILSTAREYLQERGFIELLTPLVGPVTDPAVRGAKQLDVDYYGAPYKLMASSLLYKQAALMAFDKVFYVAPNARLEPPETKNTRRHLVEFHQLDIEIANAPRSAAMRCLESLLSHVIESIVSHRSDELESIGRNIDRLRLGFKKPYDQKTHNETVEGLVRDKQMQLSESEISWDNERFLSERADRPFFVLDYPKGSRGFYDKENDSCEDILDDFDLIVPEGYGEISSGSEREYDYSRVVTRMRETGENPAKYEWHLRSLQSGLVPPSAGFGIGIERLTAYICGLDAIWEASAFPKIPGMLLP